ncbi:MAG: hypothetical protein AB1485_01875, partial [Candidatus Thermoplasmatota archaeon]
MKNLVVIGVAVLLSFVISGPGNGFEIADVKSGTTIVWNENVTLTEDYVVPENFILVINPGVVVTFDTPSADISSILYIEGTLKALGSEDKPVIFKRLDSDWRAAVQFNASAVNFTITCAVFEAGAPLESYCARVEIRNTTFYAPATLIDYTQAVIENCAFYANLEADSTGGVRIKNANFYNARVGVASDGNVTIENCKFECNVNGDVLSLGTYDSAKPHVVIANCTFNYTGAASYTDPWGEVCCYKVIGMENCEGKIDDCKLNTTGRAFSAVDTNISMENVAAMAEKYEVVYLERCNISFSNSVLVALEIASLMTGTYGKIENCSINGTNYIEEKSSIAFSNSTLCAPEPASDVIKSTSFIVLVNTTINGTITIGVGGLLESFSYVSIKAVTKGGIPIKNTAVLVKNLTGFQESFRQTSTDGWARKMALKEFTQTYDSKIYHTPHTVTATARNVTRSATINISNPEEREVTFVFTGANLTINGDGPTPYPVGEEFNVTTIVRNIEDGFSESGNLTLEFYKDNDTIPFSVKSLGRLNVGEQNTIVSDNTQFEDLGNHTIKVKLISDSAEDWIERPVLILNTTIIDVTPPIITILSPTNGTITNQNITLYYVVSDNIDSIENIALTGPANGTTYSNEDFYNLTITARDRVGNIAQTTVLFIIDKTPPNTEANIAGTLRENGWYSSNVTVSLAAQDTISGRNLTYYSWDGSAWLVYQNVLIVTDEGVHILYYHSVDFAGNVEAIRTLEIKINKTVAVEQRAVGNWLP